MDTNDTNNTNELSFYGQNKIMPNSQASSSISFVVNEVMETVSTVHLKIRLMIVNLEIKWL